MTNSSTQLTAKKLFDQDNVKQRFHDLLGQKSQGFIVSILQIIAGSEELQKADPHSVYNAAATAAAMDLAINPNLGFAYIIPYWDGKKFVAQFQMGWRGYVQLAQRTSLYHTAGTTEIYENQVHEINYITKEVKFNNVEPKGKVIGFYSYFALLSGFEKSFYMSHDQVKAHALKYSKSYKKGRGVWADGEEGFIAMGKKTVLKLLLSGYGPMSIDLQKAIVTDQALILNEDATEVSYVDNSGSKEEPTGDQKKESLRKNQKPGAKVEMP